MPGEVPYARHLRTVIPRLIARAWLDRTFEDQLLADPAPALQAAGVELPPGATVRFIRDDRASIGQWSLREEADGHELVVPIPPAPDPDRLSADDLEGVEGGGEYCCSSALTSVAPG